MQCTTLMTLCAERTPANQVWFFSPQQLTWEIELTLDWTSFALRERSQHISYNTNKWVMAKPYCFLTAASFQGGGKKGKTGLLGLNIIFWDLPFISNNETLGNTKLGKGKIIHMLCFRQDTQPQIELLLAKASLPPRSKVYNQTLHASSSLWFQSPFIRAISFSL